MRILQDEAPALISAMATVEEENDPMRILQEELRGCTPRCNSR